MSEVTDKEIRLIEKEAPALRQLAVHRILVACRHGWNILGFLYTASGWIVVLRRPKKPGFFGHVFIRFNGNWCGPNAVKDFENWEPWFYTNWINDPEWH